MKLGLFTKLISYLENALKMPKGLSMLASEDQPCLQRVLQVQRYFGPEKSQNLHDTLYVLLVDFVEQLENGHTNLRFRQ